MRIVGHGLFSTQQTLSHRRNVTRLSIAISRCLHELHSMVPLITKQKPESSTYKRVGSSSFPLYSAVKEEVAPKHLLSQNSYFLEKKNSLKDASPHHSDFKFFKSKVKGYISYISSDALLIPFTPLQQPHSLPSLSKKIKNSY